MNNPFNQPRKSRWHNLDSRRPENMPFDEWVEEQTRRSNESQSAWFGEQSVVEGVEAFLRVSTPEGGRQERQRRARREGWNRGGDPGE